MKGGERVEGFKRSGVHSKGGMIMVTRKHSLLTCFIVLSIVFGIASCSHLGKKPATPKITYNVAPEAQVTNFEYYLDGKCKIAEKPCLTFKITVKNVSNEPVRFISSITLPKEGKSVGGYIPVKGVKDKVTKKRGPAVIEPGKEKTEIYPMFYYETPRKIEVEVIPMR
jgi:hypothetical protein